MRFIRPTVVAALFAPFLGGGQCQNPTSPGPLPPGDVILGSFSFTAMLSQDTCGLVPDASALAFSAKVTGQTDAGTSFGAAMLTRSFQGTGAATEFGVYTNDDAGLGFVVCGAADRFFEGGTAIISETVSGRMYTEAQSRAMGGRCPSNVPLGGLANACAELISGQQVPMSTPVPQAGQVFALICGQIMDTRGCGDADAGGCDACATVTYDLTGVGSQP